MSLWNLIWRLRAVVCAPLLASALACSEYVDEVDVEVAPSVEAKVDPDFESCKQNVVGMRLIARNALNAARNPLADRVALLDWNAFCACFAPELAQLARSRKAARARGEDPPYAELETLRDSIAVTCAEMGAPPASAEIPPVEPHPSGNLAANDARFEGLVDHCVRSPEGYLTNVRIHLEAQRSPRASKVMEMNPAEYCECYVAQMRRGLGDDVAHRFLSYVRIPSDLDIIAISQTSDGAYETCAAAQIPFN